MIVMRYQDLVNDMLGDVLERDDDRGSPHRTTRENFGSRKFTKEEIKVKISRREENAT